ncbi:hypothetical protein ACVPOS_00735 [Staphylococcus aureus]
MNLTNVTGYKYGNKVTFIDNSQQIDVTLTGNEKLTVKDDDEVSNVDVFVEEKVVTNQLSQHRLVGITKTNGLNIRYCSKR